MGASFSKSSSEPVTKSPFGELPFQIGGGLRTAFQRPLTQGFGFGGGKNSPYAKGQGPLATFIGQARDPLAQYLPNMTNLGTDITTGAKSSFGGYQSAVDRFMQQLPGFQNTLGGISNTLAGDPEQAQYARTMAEDAFSPLPGRSTFQEASRRALAPMREGAAARGMLEGGAAGVGEQNMLSDLAFQALQGDQANRAQAVQGMQGLDTETRARAGMRGDLTQAGANLASMGPQMMQQLFSAYPQLAQTLASATGMPMDAMNNLMSFFASTQDPAYSLLRLVAPTVAQKSESISQSAGMGG
jgi:hypothetical protein